MDKQSDDKWKVRRRLVNLTLLFCAGSVLYLMICGKDIELHSSMSFGLIALAGSVINGYIFGATWGDKS